jgi:hypothetical protein
MIILIPRLIAGLFGLGILVLLVNLILKIPATVIWAVSNIPPQYRPLVIFISIIGSGAAMYIFKSRHQLWYGATEFAFAAASAWSAAPKFMFVPNNPSWIAAAAAAYLSVRSIENIIKGYPYSRTPMRVRRYGAKIFLWFMGREPELPHYVDFYSRPLPEHNLD